MTLPKLNNPMACILGSGLGALGESLDSSTKVSYQDIPGFLNTQVSGHKGFLIYGKLGSRDVVFLQGRNHFYEGHSMEEVVYPIRFLKSLGVQTLILTNSAGGMGEGMKPGDPMLITDHINLMGNNPLIGSHRVDEGPRFPDMTDAYDPTLSRVLKKCFEEHNLNIHSGVYAGVTGPSYETPAEIRFLKHVGASAVGMSTVHECIMARYLGMKVVGLSCITNLAAGLSGSPLSHSEVKEVASQVEKNYTKALKSFIQSI